MAEARPAQGAPARVERARAIEARRLSRRSFMRVSVFAGLTLTVGSWLAGFLGFFNLRNPTGSVGVFRISADRIPGPGADPARITEGRFWLANLSGTEGDVFQTGATGGLVALFWKCPHLGCTVPWISSFNGAQVAYPGIVGWFRCPCHGSTYSKAGVRVFGPAPRSMDRFDVTLNADGSVNVDTRTIIGGSIDNALGAVPYAG